MRLGELLPRKKSFVLIVGANPKPHYCSVTKDAEGAPVEIDSD